VSDLPRGAEFAGCRIEALAGRGGMGVVYRATQLSLGRPVAVKLIAADRAADAGFRERFERESRLAAAIDHPNVIPVHAAGEEDGRLYLVMRYVQGTDLHALLAREGRLEPARAAAIVAQVAAGLDAAHAAGLVHRDVKPANVLIGGPPGAEHVYLSDFGLTRLEGSDSRLTTTGEWIGTVDFMSPEHLRGDRTDARSDVYALGCVLCAALTGRAPFPRATVPATLLAHLHDGPPRPSAAAGVPAAFDRVLARALAKAPADRYPSAGDLGRAAMAAARGEHVTESERSVARGLAAPATSHHDGPEPSNGNGHTAATVRKPPTTPAHGLPAGPPPEEDGSRPAFVKIKRSRRRLRRAAAAVLGAAGVAAVVVALATGLAGGGTGQRSGPLTPGEVQDVVDDFASAYGREDARDLSRTLARDVTRVGVAPGDRQAGRAAVLAEYRGQFAGNAVEAYRLSDLEVKGGPVGRAEGRYEVERAGAGPFGGAIVFGVQRERGRARIGLIATRTDA
jgi:serine/threonine-protein kinase